MKERIRRNWKNLVGAGIIAAAVGLAACEKGPSPEEVNETVTAAVRKDRKDNATPTPDRLATIAAGVAENREAIGRLATTAEEIAQLPPLDTTPPAEQIARASETQSEMVQREEVPVLMVGIQEELDSNNKPLTVEVANSEFGGKYTNTQGIAEGWLAEPGVILFGPGEDGETVDAAGPHADYFNSGNQFRLKGEIDHAKVPEGAFLLVSGNGFTARFGDRAISVLKKPNHNALFLVRGLFEDGQQGTDRNTQVEFSNFSPRNVLVTEYPAGAFFSEEHFGQIANLSHTGGTNCGREGCAGLTAVFHDLNTGFTEVYTRDQLDSPWNLVFSNKSK